MRSYIILAGMVSLLFGLSARAENSYPSDNAGPVGYGGPPAGYVPANPQPNPNPYVGMPSNAPGLVRPATPSDWDSRVFNLEPQQAPAPNTALSPVTGTTRFIEAAPQYNTEQEARWKETCRKFKDRGDMASYRQCYSMERQRDAEGLRASQALVERSQGFRNPETDPIAKAAAVRASDPMEKSDE